jgi:mono/diheme cytochrome c family protein
VQVSAGWLASLVVLVGCGGERQTSSAAARDTAAVAAVDTSGSRADTPARSVDTAMTASRDTAARRDTAVASPPVTRAKPPTRPKPTAVKPKPSTPDTTAGAASPDTASRASATSSPTSNDAGAPLRDPYHQAPLDTVAPGVYDGWKQFNLNCARCHGEDVQGTTIAPHLIVSLRPDGPINTKQIFMQTVCAGRPAKGMPSWCSLGMEMSTIEAIYSYVKGRSDGKIHSGRPARRPG